MESPEQLAALLEIIRNELKTSGDSSSSLKEVQVPEDDSSSETWNQIQDNLNDYKKTNSNAVLWEIVSDLYDLSMEYREQPIEEIKGIGETRAERLGNLDITTINDLVTHYPRSYADRRYVDDIRDVEENGPVSILGEVVAAGVIQGRKPRYEVRLGDETGVIRLNFWNQTYLKNTLNRGNELFCYGEVEDFRGIKQMNNPDFEIIEDDSDLEESRTIKPIYSLTEGITNKQIRCWIDRALKYVNPILIDCLPKKIRSKNDYPSQMKSFQNIHFPEDPDCLGNSRERLIFEEFFFYQLVFVLQSWSIDRQTTERSYENVRLMNRFLESLPFTLTSDQETVLKQIERDLASDHPMHRLLQGDVGTGKTVVAAASLLRVIGNNFQTALMAPTEVLAEQHYDTMQDLFSELDCRVEYLIGSLGTNRKEKIKNDLAEGKIDIIVGTHALIQSTADFDSLAYVVIDEQHRFGVEQRKKLREKGPSVDMLVMSATPIPRSLALTTYGDLNISTIEEFPTGPKKIKTQVEDQKNKKIKSIYQSIREGIQSGAQAFFIFPAIESNKEAGLTGAKDSWQKARESEFFDNITIGLVHGQMDRNKKQSVMEKFRKGSIQLLFSTTVIEVGIDVPEASYMVIHESEQFGLAQLHQLRGRIGRSGQEAWCYLLTSEGCSDKSLQRLNILAETQDGFEVSKKDMKIRGMGDMTGTKQSGLKKFNIGNIWEHRKKLIQARDYAERLVKNSNGLNDSKYSLVKKKLDKKFPEAQEYISIG